MRETSRSSRPTRPLTPIRAFHAAHDAMLCIANSAYVESADRVTSSADAWLKDSAAMAELFSDLPEAIGEYCGHCPALRRCRA